MRTNFLFIFGIVVTLSIVGCGKQRPTDYPEDVPMRTYKSYDSLWYENSYKNWSAYAEKHPEDEYAWKSSFLALRYLGIFKQDSVAMDDLVRKIEKSLPDSYIYNYVKYRTLQFDGGAKYAEKALTKLPEELQADDIQTWLCYFLMLKNDTTRAEEFARKYIESGFYSEALMTMAQDELDCMEKNAVYVDDGDASLISKWLIQFGKGQHRDKTVLLTFINDTISKIAYSRLGLSPSKYKDANYFEVIKDVATSKKLPLYVSNNTYQEPFQPLKDVGMYSQYNISDDDAFKKLVANYGYYKGLDVKVDSTEWEIARRHRFNYLNSILRLEPSKLERLHKEFPRTVKRIVPSLKVILDDYTKYVKAIINKEQIADIDEFFKDQSERFYYLQFGKWPLHRTTKKD